MRHGLMRTGVILAALAAAPMAIAADCGLTALPDLKRWKGTEPTCTLGDTTCSHNDQEVGAAFGPFAVASAGAYYSNKDTARTDQRGIRARTLQLESYDPAFKSQKYLDETDSGLGLRVHHKTTADLLTVVIAFRGTDSVWNWTDMASNLSWFTRWFRSADQYERARLAVAAIRAEAEKTAGTRKVAYIATGHSLGGALARHIGSAFSCTAVVAFDPSPVTNEMFLATKHKHQLVIVQEAQDWTSWTAAFEDQVRAFWAWVSRGTTEPLYRRYPIELLKDKQDQHRIIPFAVTMARQQVCCDQRHYWAGLQKEDAKRRANLCPVALRQLNPVENARRFYCDGVSKIRAGTTEPVAGSVCDFTSPRRGERCGLRLLIDSAKSSGG